MNKSNTDKFIMKAMAIHGNEYDYSFVKYIDSESKIEILCREHQSFWQTPHSHLRGRRCPNCYLSKGRPSKYNQKDFILKASNIHGDKNDYSLVKYIDTYVKVEITCKIHNESYWQAPREHVKGSGCPKCARELINEKLSLSKEQFINKADIVHNNNKYDYSLSKYKNNRTKIEIICKSHNQSFWQTPNDHLDGRRCPICAKSKYKDETIVKDWLKSNEFIIEEVVIRANGRLYFPDFYISSKNIIIEYNGAQHYYPVRFGNMSIDIASLNFEKQKIRDEQMRQYCAKNNINLLEIDGRQYTGHKLVSFLENYFNNIVRIAS